MIQYNRFVLGNGLRVLVHEDSSTPMAVVNVMYDVGARDEDPNKAYEWENFRLSRWRINTRKRNHKDVLDPFTIGESWFELDFTTFGIKPNSELKDANIKKAIQETIDRLDLDNTDYREARESWFNNCRDNIAELEKKAPFIAYEMKRQGI